MFSFPKIIRPLGAYTLYGLAWKSSEGKQFAIALDSLQGNLLKIDPETDGATVLNPYATRQFLDGTGIAISGETLWLAKDNCIYYCSFEDFDLQPFLELPETIEGIAVSDGAVYVSSKQERKIFVFGRATRGLIRAIPAPGIGQSALALRGEELWVSDRTEETVYCLDAKTGEIKSRALTPFIDPTGLAFLGNDLYVLYTGLENYIRDNPNEDDPYSVQVRDRTFIHQLKLTHVKGKPSYTLSNGFLVEMVYLEEISQNDPQELVHNLDWEIAMPCHTDRQKVLSVQPVGLPFVEKTSGDQRVAVFKLDKLRADESRLFGWRAMLELRGIKYELDPAEVESVGEIESAIQAEYLYPDGDLAMGDPLVIAAAKEAVGTETNILRKMLAIREYVYDKLSYRLQTSFGSPEVVLARGNGSCGEYVRVLLALARLNGIACRDVGRYKCPPFAELHNVPLYPEYNHVWIEFYIPGIGWLPMESNPDDTGERPYPKRFFMGLPWYHVEIGKGITFETTNNKNFSIGDASINHMRFKILGELDS